MGSGFVIPAVFGWLMQWGKSGRFEDYTADDFNRAMLMIPIAFVFGINYHIYSAGILLPASRRKD